MNDESDIVLVDFLRDASGEERADDEVGFGHVDSFDHALWAEGEFDSDVMVVRCGSEQE